MVVDNRVEVELYEELYVELAEEVVVASVYVL